MLCAIAPLWRYIYVNFSLFGQMSIKISCCGLSSCVNPHMLTEKKIIFFCMFACMCVCWCCAAEWGDSPAESCCLDRRGRRHQTSWGPETCCSGQQREFRGECAHVTQLFLQFLEPQSPVMLPQLREYAAVWEIILSFFFLSFFGVGGGGCWGMNLFKVCFRTFQIENHLKV